MTSETAVFAVSTIATSFWRYYSHIIGLEIFVQGLNRNTVHNSMRMATDGRNFFTQSNNLRLDGRVGSSKNETIAKQGGKYSGVISLF